MKHTDSGELKVLAIDTSTEYCSVAYCDGEQIIYRGREAPREHADLVLQYVDEILKEAQVSLDQLDGLALGKGPGSFTGVRIAASIGQGLAFSHNLPVVGISSLEAMAYQAYRLHDASQVVAAIDARMGEVYFGTYSVSESRIKVWGEESVVPPSNVLSCVADEFKKQDGTYFGVGTGWVTYPDALSNALESLPDIELSHSVRFPHAIDLATLGRERLKRGEGVAAEDFQVHYVRNEVTWKKLPGK
ncbi:MULTISPECIES: tRNA (adenosine(37)-N6)-threonylcarbamoyltransferase complex dimerization subunit type 1 TsaB [Gammaproteobacteria]|uniref:tRNA (adenosine(37)-N6)-threonylcarbamoyltransferase complex dimerization subunit type 1 TsaB n=1 Tax=Gammaproteobacteria TaxID=1236 RepID=UPI000DD0805B|nr:MULTISPECIES: tRNA (adenosine(37)-N6)-threonylcarbamoyltransferase complex dimerization subunit type 1 TsaB [Gammaproteobacteria]RTE87610.1 tRNA (adenosine(37)-N6)-threonylcarbamoyltransferase complex dimerization subunit type 1 TsaB [Aliidiomarina sp. B3213]TCZ92605.1 tRNA (adenosine(37)-N6)-threonylcarbamoyltransferase complex dimerization subunit type 1 TsaB [Lysobacter sp. N42]